MPSTAAFPNDFFRPTATWPVLRLRAALLRKLRTFFDELGFLEVETPILSQEVVVERHLDPLRTTLFADPRDPDSGPRYWLQTSPEAHMKRLLAAGGDAIYQVTRAFRGGERGDRHNPEFTIVEWYRRGDQMADGMTLLSDLCHVLLARGPAQRISYREAFQQHVGLNPFTATVDELAAAALAHGATAPPELLLSDRDAWLNFLLAELVEPRLGRGSPTILFDYPPFQAALAEIGRPEDDSLRQPTGGQVAKRFELYVDGLELANGYQELLDAEELEQRMNQANDQRVTDGKPPLPPATQLLDAMRAGIPFCTGAALGFDRIVMLAARATHIHDVLSFPIDRA